MRIYEDFFDDIATGDEMVKSSDMGKTDYEFAMILEEEVFIPDTKFSEAPDWKVWNILFVRFINLIDNTKFIDNYDAEVRFVIPQYIRFLASTKMSAERIVDELKACNDYYVNKERFAENKNIIHEIIEKLFSQLKVGQSPDGDGVWLNVLHTVKFNPNKFPVSKFDKMKPQYLHIYEYSKLFCNSLITNTHCGNRYRNGELKIIDAENADKQLYYTKMWSHYMNNREIIEFYQTINSGNEEWDKLDAKEMASQKQYDGDEYLGTIDGKYDSYAAIKPFVRNVMNNDFFDFRDAAADITSKGEFLKLFVRVDKVKNTKQYTAPKIFQFIEECLFGCTEIQRAAISLSEICDIKVFFMCDNSNMPMTKKLPKNKDFGEMYMHTENYSLYRHTINITITIVDENCRQYGDFFHTDPMNSLCRSYQTEISTIKKNKKFTNYIFA